MKINCPSPQCSLTKNTGPLLNQVIQKGFYYRSSDSRRIRRYYCKRCKKNFSAACFKPTYYQKKRRVNIPLSRLFSSGVSQRRAAILLGINRKTVVRKFRFLAKEEAAKHEVFMKRYDSAPLLEIQFDDLETSEHTKCKPLSVALAIDPVDRKILNFQVNCMPAKGHLAVKARKKYGYRPDQRTKGWNQLMKDLVPYASSTTTFTSDENPHYPKHLFRYHPKARHIQVKGGRGAITGQGELKKLHHDPLFSLNHTCAMLRANLNRLFRKTWCTTKNKQGLIDHLWIYTGYHNRVLTVQSTGLGAS